MAIKSLYRVLTVLMVTLSSCTSVDYQTLKIDHQNRKFELINSEEFVIDSIGIEKLGKLYYSLSLRDKSKGSPVLNLKEDNENYQAFVDSLDLIHCDETGYSMGIFIRKKGSKTVLTKEIAKNFKHVDDIQTFRGLTYKPCQKRIDTLEAERRYR